MQIVEKLHKIAKLIHLISEFDLTADHSIVDRILRFRNLRTYENTVAVSFEGEGNLSGVTVRKKATDEKTIIPVRGVFVSIGMKPNSGLVTKLVEYNQKREIVIGPDCSTTYRGIFAAGDTTNVYGKRIIIASGEGAKAAMAVREYLLEKRVGEKNHMR
jgi:alkyl hydroperoxide reductase subunit F